MASSTGFKPGDIYSIPGADIASIYEANKMTVHFQGMSKTLQFPQTVALQGAPTCSVGVSPYGLYNRLNDAGRLILLNQKAVQYASAPFIRIGEKEHVMLTQKVLHEADTGDDIPAIQNYYHPPVAEKNVTLTIATPSLEIRYKLPKTNVTRRLISPFLSGNGQTLMPIGVEEYEVVNLGDKPQTYTVVVPRPSLVNIQEKELKPTDQDSIYIGLAPVHGQTHVALKERGMHGVVMGSADSENRMVLAAIETPGVAIDVQPYFCLNRLAQDLMLNADGTFYEKRPPLVRNDYGAAVSLTFTLKGKASIKVPVAIVLDFPTQVFIDGKTFERKYVKGFRDAGTRAADLAKIAFDNYQGWWQRTVAIQKKMFEYILASPSYKGDRAGALRLSRLLFNEFHFPLSNAAVWIEDAKGEERARFLECFDYAYINPSDVDWYSPVLLMLFPHVEEELCQSFINSINAEDPTPRFYHFHASFVEARKHYAEHPEEYNGQSMTQVRDAFKIKGSVAHDVGAMPKGHALRNVSDYAWYNNNYWVDLYPKLVMRVLRNVKYTGDTEFLRTNWDTLKFGLEALLKLDFDGDGVPEGYHNEVKNTFDNLVLFGADAYDATSFIGGCQAMITMARMMKDADAERRIQGYFDKAGASLEKLWRDGTNKQGNKLQYYITCFDQETGKKNTDIWTNQLDAIWYMLACGEAPFIPEGRIKQILKTIYKNNRTAMGWAMCRTENGKKVESEQGQDVYTTSNYVFAQLLDYYGLVKESKDVYKHMDKVVFEYGNSMITPDNLRAELEKEEGEKKPGPHYIVAAYPRPGAVWTHVFLQHIKSVRARKKSETVDSPALISFLESLFKVT
jgi:uncharacterized protein (DUF608 family)